MIRNWVFLVVFASFRLWGLEFSDFDVYQGLFTREEINERLKTYLEKETQIGAYYQLTDDAFYIGDLANQKIDFILRLANSSSQKKNYQIASQQGLQGVKIAIDPGHFGGIFAELEERCVKISANETQSIDPIVIEEGTLTFLTALELKSLLEAEGATVFLTRASISQGALEQDFFCWLRDNPQIWASKDPLSKLFRNHYNREDLKQRALKINSFHPDITLILHYNGHLSEEERQQKQTLTASNYNLLFIPGAFCANELQTPDERYHFLRLLLTDSLDNSLRLSQCLTKHLESVLGVPLVNELDHPTYLRKMCLRVADGIYSRNLALTRLVHSPLCYGETLIQNNKQEIYKLSLKDSEIAQISCSSRIKEVARAYFNGIKDYFAEE